MRNLKVLLLVCLVSVVIIVSGCSGSNENSDSASTEQVNLKFWFPGNSTEAEQATKEIISEFEQKNSNIKVEYAFIPWAEYFQKLTVAYAGKVEPDIHGLGLGQLISTVNQDNYMNLNKFIEADQWDGADDFYPDLLKAGQWEGGQYGLIHADVRPFSWRKDLFKEANLDPDTPPQTIDELFEYASKLKKVENGMTVIAGIDIASSVGEQAYVSLAYPLGLDYYNADGNPTFDSDENIALTQKITDLFKEGAIIKSDQLQLEGTPYENGMAAMGFANPSITSKLIDSVGLENVGVALPPEGIDGRRTSFLGGTFITMSKTSKHPEEAWEFMKFWFEPEQLLKFSQAIGLTPARQSLEEQYGAIAPYNDVVMNSLSDTQAYLPSPSWAILNKYMRIALEESYYEKKPVAEAMKSNAKKAREELGIK